MNFTPPAAEGLVTAPKFWHSGELSPAATVRGHAGRMNLFRRKESPAKKGPSLGSSAGAPSPMVYRERSANHFQEEELARLRTGGQPAAAQRSAPPMAYRERVVGQEYPPVASPPHAAAGSPPAGRPPAASPPRAAADDRERDRQFEQLKKLLEIALREGDSDKIIEGYRNLGQHFMSGKTLAEQQAAKQMFEKALDHAGLMNNETEQVPAAAHAPAQNLSPAVPPLQHQQQPVYSPAPGDEIDVAAFMGMTSQPSPPQPQPPARDTAVTAPAHSSPELVHKTLELKRAPLPGMALPPDGLAGVGFSFETTPAGIHIISTLAPTGSAANSGRMYAGDLIKMVDGVLVQGLSAGEVIRLVKGTPGSIVALALESRYPEPQARAPQDQQGLQSLALSSPSAAPDASAVSSPVIPPVQVHPPLQQQEQAVPEQHSSPSPWQQSPPPQQPPPQPYEYPSAHGHSHALPQDVSQASDKSNDPPIVLQEGPPVVAPQPQQEPLQPPLSFNQPPPPQQQASSEYEPEVSTPGKTASELWTREDDKSDITQEHGEGINRTMPPEPGMPAPQNPAMTTPGLVASPALHSLDQTQSKATPASRKRGKRLVFTREPGKGQVVLPEHPVGIGLNLSSSSDRGGAPFLVDSLLADSPAANCGQVAPGDLVYSIDGVRVKDKSLPEVIQMLKGPSGTQVVVIFQLVDKKLSTPGSAVSMGRMVSLQAFEARLDLIAAEGLPTSSTSDTGLCDPYLCVSLLPESVEPESASALVLNHKQHAQANTKTCRKTVNPVWKETRVIRDMHNESVVADSNRPLPSAHERTPLSGQVFNIMFTVHSESGGSDDFIGSALLRHCRPGPCCEYKLPLLDSSNRAVGFSGQVAMVHVRLTYCPAEGDIHQAEAARKAAEMAASRKRRQGGSLAARPPTSDASNAGIRSDSPRDEAFPPTTPTLGAPRAADDSRPSSEAKAAQESPPVGLAALWVQAYGHKSPGPGFRSTVPGNSGNDVQTDLLAFVPPPSLMATPNGPNGTYYGDKRLHTPSSLNGSSGIISNGMLDQIRTEMESKDKLLAILQTEHQRLRQHLQQVTLSHDRAAKASTDALAQMKVEVQAKSEQVRELQEQTMQSKASQERLEQQLNSAQQLVRGSLLQHERYEATTEQQAQELSQLKRDKERLEREVEAMRAEQLEGAASNGAAQSLNDVIEQERRRFRRALAEERSRSADALERQREDMQHEVQQARDRSKREASHALLDAAVEKGMHGDTAQALEYQVQVLRSTLDKERQTAERSFADLREEITALQAMAGKGMEETKMPNSSIVKAWYSPGGEGGDNVSLNAKASRLEAALGKVTEERDHWRRREAEVRMQLDQSRGALLEAQEMESDLSETVREKEQAVQELREYEEEVEKLQAQRDNLQAQLKQMANDNNTLSRILEQQQFQGATGTSSPRGGGGGGTRQPGGAAGSQVPPSQGSEPEVEELKSKLKEKEKALVKLQKDYKRLQVIAAGRSAA